MNEYLQPTEYASYGVETKATIATVRAASLLINAYLGRKEGLLYKRDAIGNPCYMDITPNGTLVAGAAILPGTNVRIPYAGQQMDNNFVCETLILNRDNDTLVECCVIQSVEAGYLTLNSVRNSHASGCTMDLGMSIMEESTLPENRSIARLSRPNPVQLWSGAGRYGYGRRSQQIRGDMQDFNLLAAVSSFGGPPLWIPWDPKNASVSFRSGEVWVPAGVLLAYFTDVRIWYLAGYDENSLPDDIKQATANIINLGKETGLGANIRSRGMPNSTSVTKFENNMIDANTRNMLAPYKARNFN